MIIFLLKVKTILKRGGSDEVLDLMIDEILLKSAKLRSVSSSQNLLQLIPNPHSDARDVVALLHPSTRQTLRAHAQSTAHTSVYRDMMLATQPCASLFLYAMSTHASVLPSVGLCPHMQTRGDIVHTDCEQEKEQVCWQQHQWQQQQCQCQ